MFLLFNTLSRLDMAFLPGRKSLLISWLQSWPAVILEPKKIKSLTVSIVSPSICHEVMGPDAMIFIFWKLSFKPAFSLSFFTFIKTIFYFFFAFCHKGGVICMSEIIHTSPGNLDNSSSLACHMMHSAYKLNKQGDNIHLNVLLFQFWTSQLFHIWFCYF